MLNVVILAAGQGKRMQSSLPKVLHPIGGRPMLAHVINTARALQPQRIVVVVGHGAEQVQQAFAGQSDLHFVRQQPALGTGHAVRQATSALSQTAASTLVLYGDVPLVQASSLQALLAANPSGVAVLTQLLDDPGGYGRIQRDAEGQIIGIVEDRDANARERAIKEVNTGLLAAPTAVLLDWLSKISNDNAQAEYYLTDIVGLAVADGLPVVASHPQEAWETLGVNSREQQAQVERAWQLAQAQRLMAAGASLADPGRIDIRGQLDCGPDVFIDVGCVFEGDVQVGAGAHIEPYCILRDTQIKTGARIRAYSHLEGACVGPQATVGPYARLRPGSRLGQSSHVGNFVEVKNSVLGPNSKANHLSYVGDTSVGERVNIGAGTITCNYDGVHKHRTVIEDDAFIGSGSQLVAPVRVGRGATIGAGTTLTRDAPQEQLTLARTPQTIISGWKRPKPTS